MASKTSLLCLGLLALNLPLSSFGAQTLFSEDFESKSYTAGMPVPSGPNAINHGEWGKPVPQTRPAIVVEDNGKHALELKAFAGSPKGVRALAYLGESNTEAKLTSEALEVSFRFKITAPLDRMYIQVVGSDGRAKGNLSMDEQGHLTVSFGGKYQPLGNAIEPGKWYSVKVSLPEQPHTSKRYQVTLYDAGSGNELAALGGRLARSVEKGGENYQYIDIQHNTPGQALYIDDLVAKTIN